MLSLWVDKFSLSVMYTPRNLTYYPLHYLPVDVDKGELPLYRRGLRTHPCGAPVLRISGVEMLFPTLTNRGRPVRKSRIQLQREVFSPRVLSDQLLGHYGVER